MAIRTHNSIPMFVQISDTLRQQIERGAFQVGDVIPSEREYATQLKVSRMTVRAALDKLVNEGLLVRQHGRGTIVAAAKISRPLGFMSFSQDMQLRGAQPSSRVVRCTAEVADSAVAAQLDLPVGARVVLLERVRMADGEPLAVERAHLPFERFGSLLGIDWSCESLYAVLEREFGCSPSRSDETVEAVLLTAVDARLLGVTRNSPALFARRITRDDRGTPIESTDTLYRGDRYRMVLTRQR
jgi:GntR family transcriptional regulator